MNDLTKLAEEIAIDLWHLFRSIAMVIDQSQRFVAAPGSGEAVSEEEPWLRNLHTQSEEIAQIAEEMLLRAFRTAVDPVNFLILKKLNTDRWIPNSELRQCTGLTRMIVSERVNDLIQVGLVVKDVQTGQVQGTTAGQKLVKLMEEIHSALARTIREKLHGERERKQEQK